MYLLRKYVRQADAAPLPEPSQHFDLVTCGHDLRDLAIFARRPAVGVCGIYSTKQNLPSPALWLAMSVRF